MFVIYHSNHLDVQKDILLNKLMHQQHQDPFQAETILVQSSGMELWLQMQIADKIGVAANINFQLPASFFWQQYAEHLTDIPKLSSFNKYSMVWFLMELIPQYLTKQNFQALHDYLGDNYTQHKLLQLAAKIADLFDQYLIYRPEWLTAWETDNQTQIKSVCADLFQANTLSDMLWQAELWHGLKHKITQNNSNQRHRVELHHAYLQLLQTTKIDSLPKNIFVFGISSIPQIYLTSLIELSKQTNVHLFFNNPSKHYWGDLSSEAVLTKLMINQHKNSSQINEELTTPHPLLSSWGKLGSDFLYLLNQIDYIHQIDAYVEQDTNHLLGQLQQQILNLDIHQQKLNLTDNDNSISVHNCYSPMREVEVLHDNLLNMFALDEDLTPKDIVVMVTDIDKYSPYIQAVFSGIHDNDKRKIPFSIADRGLFKNDQVSTSFIHLLSLKNDSFSAEAVLQFLDIEFIREKFLIDASDLDKLRHWVKSVNIRFQLEQATTEDYFKTYASWQFGLERMLLGSSMCAKDGFWQDIIAFDESFGLSAQLVGKLANFIQQLTNWHKFIQTEHPLHIWHTESLKLLDTFFSHNPDTSNSINYLSQQINNKFELIATTGYSQNLTIEVIHELFINALEQPTNSSNFLRGKVNFCTLLPMRAIPFKVICLLGMNNGEYPRQEYNNSFNLMQYQHRKGDRLKREDDLYLFLEAILSAEQKLYISYVGQSILTNEIQEPSVVVSKLLDFLAKNIDSDQQKTLSQLVQYHSMHSFNPRNFTQEQPSYANEWLVLTTEKHSPNCFKQQINNQLEPKITIQLNDLISFIKNPVEHFFHKQLNVRFDSSAELLADSENFNLDGLEQYNLRSKLVTEKININNVASVTHKLLTQGYLPLSKFADITIANALPAHNLLLAKINQYLDMPANSQSIDCHFKLPQHDINLVGEINNLYSSPSQRFNWRYGKVRDIDQIENWLYFLLLNYTTAQSQTDLLEPKVELLDYQGNPCVFTGKLEATQCEQQLLIYLQAYIDSYQQIQLIPTSNIKKWLELTENDAGLDYNINKLLAELNDKNPYWQRILSQMTTELDYQALIKDMHLWFGLMQENKQ